MGIELNQILLSICTSEGGQAVKGQPLVDFLVDHPCVNVPQYEYNIGTISLTHGN